MTATRTDATFVHGLEATVGDARRRADVSGRRVLASWTASVAAGDPLRWFAAATASERLFWEVPAAGCAYAGAGAAWEAEGSGGGRFAAVREAWRRLLGDAIVRHEGGYPLDAPLAFAGFRFDAAARPDAAWREFPDALIQLPSVLYTQRPGHAWLTVNALVSPGGGDAQIANVLASLEPAADVRPRPSEIAVRDEQTVRRDRWERAAAALLDEIDAGRVEKVVLARRLLLHAEGGAFDIEAALERLRQRYDGCRVFAVARGDACFLGASPERLIHLSGGSVSLDCLAGSAPRGASAAEDEAMTRRLLDDPKERHEHDLVRDDLLQALAPVCDGLQAPDEPTVKRLANVQHLYRAVTGRARPGTDALTLVERLHPTAAVGGLPRRSAMSLIRSFEPADRGWYAGPIGWLDAAGGGEFGVAIRSGLVRGDAALLYAGCGIVAGSQPSREYDESSIKLEAMRWALGA